jgi:hypothetical protein
LDLGDYVAIAEGIALAGTWFWVLRRNVARDGIRSKLAMYAFGAASLSVIFDLILTVILHFHQNPDDAVAGKAYLLLFPSAALAALIGLVLGFFAKGFPRIAAVLWSLVMLTSVAFSVYLIAVSA